MIEEIDDKCEGELVEATCPHCDGSGEDDDCLSNGVCWMCEGLGYKEFWQCFGCEDCNWGEVE